MTSYNPNELRASCELRVICPALGVTEGLNWTNSINWGIHMNKKNWRTYLNQINTTKGTFLFFTWQPERIVLPALKPYPPVAHQTVRSLAMPLYHSCPFIGATIIPPRQAIISRPFVFPFKQAYEIRRRFGRAAGGGGGAASPSSSSVESSGISPQAKISEGREEGSSVLTFQQAIQRLQVSPIENWIESLIYLWN
jgi:hypothetical protein